MWCHCNGTWKKGVVKLHGTTQYHIICNNLTTLHFLVWVTRKNSAIHDDVIKRKHFQRYWPFVRGIHRWLVNSPHKGQWRGALTFNLICARINSWANNGDAGDSKRHRTHCEVIVMQGNFNINSGFNLHPRQMTFALSGYVLKGNMYLSSGLTPMILMNKCLNVIGSKGNLNSSRGH